MTAKQSQEKDELGQSLERIVLYAKDVASYLDNINDTLDEILDSLRDYEIPRDRVYTHEIGEETEEY
jgi:hypothetical protein